MRDQNKTKEQLIGELVELRQRVAELETSEAERDRAEEALRESEKRYRLIAENVTDVIWAADMNFRFTYVSPSVEHLRGYSVEEVMVQSLSDVLTPASLVRATKILEEERENIERGTAQPRTVEFEFKCKDGSTVQTESTVSILCDENKIPIGILGSTRDITERKQAEEALKSAESEKEIILDSQLEHVVYQDKEHEILWLNRAACESVGMRREALIGRHCYTIWAQRSERCEDCPVALAMETGRQQEIEKETPDGRMWFIRGYPVRNVGGEIVGGIEITRDITERKRAEEALRESEERFRKIFEEGPLGMGILAPDDRFIAANATLCQMVGYTEEELTALTFYDITHPDDMDTSEQLARQLLSGEVPYIQTEKRYITKEGRTLWLNLTATFIYDDNGSPLYKLSMIEDITERKQAEEEREQLLAQIQEQARRVQQIMDTVPEGVLLLNADGQVLLANPVAERDLLVLADARVGDIITHLGNRLLAELLTSPPKGLWHEVEVDALHGQKERIFEVIARPMENGSEPEDWVLVISDATQQREIEQRVQQQERLAAVGQLAAGIAHDFNNIMATIVLYAQTTARMKELPSVVQERMGTINQQAGHATKLIQQILDFSRRAALERQPLDLALLLKDHVKLLKRTLPESIEVRLTHGPDEYMAHADPTRMQQVVTNLAVNARDAMPGGGTLCIRLERIQVRPGKSPLVPEIDPGEWVQVTVSDTGTGIPPDVLPYIFNPFFTTKAPGEGSGLGLAQVHGIVGQHGGRIDVESHTGEGTTFIIYLPALPTHSPELSGVSELESLTLPTGKGETVLVVEDNAIVRKALVESLGLLNYHTREATNGQEALAMLEQHGDDIDLLLSDVVMPGMGGIALLHALKERGLTVKVAMITGHLLEKELDELRAQGMIDWLHKPPELERLAEVIARALDMD